MSAGQSLLCLSLTSSTLAENLALARRYQRLVDMVEIRVDFLEQSQWSGIGKFPLECPLPSLCTIRRRCDGGSWIAPEEIRLQLLQTAANSNYSYIDLEADLPERTVSLRLPNQRVIRSSHDPRGTPSNLSLLARGLARNDREIPKIAVTPRGISDLKEIISVAHKMTGPRIIIGMGDYGIPTRLLATRLGNFLTFTSVGRNAAPGQLDPVTMQCLYRFGTFESGFPVFGIIGNPITHSRSPEVHNRGLSSASVPGMYIPFRVDSLAEFLELAPVLGIHGLSVTIPHKETVVPFLARVDSSVKAVEACNTLLWEDGGWTGYNTDVAGFLSPLNRLLSTGYIRRATVVGAGGAARAISWALRGANVDVLIVNRNLRRAQALAANIGADSIALNDVNLPGRVEQFSDLIVQATSVGMKSSAEDSLLKDPIASVPLTGREIVYDVVYTPIDTPLLQRANKAGCMVISGVEMLLAQAFEQFRLFTGIDYPLCESKRLRETFDSSK